VPGAALAGVVDGEVAWLKGYGLRRTGSHAPVRVDTVFGVASVSKAVTALAVLALAEGGYLDLDADVRPRLELPLVPHSLIGPKPVGAVTARLLLQHRAGIHGRGTTPQRNNTRFLDASKGGGSHRFLQTDTADVPVDIPTLWNRASSGRGVLLTYTPGEQRSYSGAGYLVLQHLIEQVTGEQFRDVMREYLGHLGATRATFELRPPIEWPLAAGHHPDGSPLPGDHELVPWAAAGGMFSDVRSMASILTTVLNRDPKTPGASLFSEFMSGTGTTVGKTARSEVTFYAGGDNGGYRAKIVGIPARRAGVVVLTNGRSITGLSLRAALERLALKSIE